MPENTFYITRLNLETLHNVRDLGGFSGEGGHVTAFGRFLRGDAPIGLSENDLDLLLSYPVRTVIDLRSPSEIHGQPHKLRDRPDIDYVNIPLLGFDMMASIIEMGGGEDQPYISMPDLYIRILEKARQPIGQVMSRLASAPPGTCFFHCTHGKDRTGLIAALLLLLVGVKDIDIIASFQTSATFLKPLFETFLDKIPEDSRHFFRTDPESMELTLTHFHLHLGPIEKYLDSCNVSSQEIMMLRQKLLV